MKTWHHYKVLITDCSNHHEDTETFQKKKKEPGEGIPGVAHLNHVTPAWQHISLEKKIVIDPSKSIAYITNLLHKCQRKIIASEITKILRDLENSPG